MAKLARLPPPLFWQAGGFYVQKARKCDVGQLTATCVNDLTLRLKSSFFGKLVTFVTFGAGLSEF